MIDRANLQPADAPLGSSIGQVFDKARHLGSSRRGSEVLRRRLCGSRRVRRAVQAVQCGARAPRHTLLVGTRSVAPPV